MSDIVLDPATLRALAAELDDEADAHIRACNCPLHRMLRDRCIARAADYRTRAIRASLPAERGPL